MSPFPAGNPVNSPQDAESDFTAAGVDGDQLPDTGLGVIDMVAPSGPCHPTAGLEALHNFFRRFGPTGGVQMQLQALCILYTASFDLARPRDHLVKQEALKPSRDTHINAHGAR